MNCKISKKICLLLILFSSIFLGTKVYAADIKATNITLVDKSSTAEVETPVMVNNEITSKITLNKENDYAVFDLTIKNNEKNKYKIESIVDNNENEYITVNYDYSKDYFQEETKVKIKFLYKNKLINQEKVSMDNLVITIKLVNDKGESTNIIINNPKTGDNISLYLIVLVLGVLGLIYTKKKINFKGIKVGISVLIFAVLLLPFVIFALDRYEIPITFKRVEAKGEFEVYDVMVEGIGIRQVTYGNEIGELPEQARDGYSFNGYEDENGVAVSPDTIVTGPMTVRPMYTVITYNITYDYNGGHAVNPNTYTVENTITLNNPTKKGYTFSGWTGSNGDTLQTEVTISSLTGDLNFVANYSANPDTAYKVIHRYPNLDGTYNEEVENLTGATDSTVRPQTRDKTGFTSPALQDIVINAEGTSELIYTYTRNNYNLTLTNPEDIESAFTTGSYPYETEITVKAKDKVGYTFSKWSDNETAKEYTFELVKDTELYPIYTPNTDTAYTVLHKKQNLDETYTLEETENLTGTTDAEVTPGVKTYTGFTSPQEQTVRIKPDGTLVVEYLYTRNRYTLNIEDKDKIEEDKSGEYYYGTEITVVAKDIPGYVFTGWENGGNTKVYTFTLTEDKTIKPLYTPGESTPYTVVHKTMNLDGTTYTVVETENLTGVTDTNVTPNVKTYTGFTSPSTQTVKVKGDGTTVVEYLYTRNKYSLIYVDNDNIDLTNSTAPGEYYYGKEITIKAKEIPGYTFKQWSTGETDNPLTVILEDNLVINPEYIPNKYNVIFNSNTGTGTMDNQQMTYDTEAALSKNLFTKPGYVFKGWNTKADKTGTHYEDEALVKNLVPSGNITLYAEWVEAQAMFETGAIVNTKMKRLAGNSSSNINTFDNNTISIQKSSTKPDISSMTSDNIVSIANTTYNAPIYMWYDNGIIYWWSEDLTPSLNDDSKSMFYRLNGVLNIDVSSFDTSNVTNMSNMFANCTSLTSLDLSSFDTSNVTDMSSMFEFSSNLKTLDISSFNTSNVTNMSDMFNVCNNLTNLNVNNFDTSNVTNMSGMFGGCKKLTELDVTHFNTSKVTDMSSMFSNCNDLTELDVTHFNTSKVTDISGMFKNCGSLDTLNVTNFETSNVTDMSLLFYGCSSLTTLDLSHFNTNKVTNMSSMFRDCKNITELDLDNFDTSNVEDFTSLFSGCNNLEYIDLSSFETSKVTGMGFMFSDCKKLTTLDLSHFDTSEVTKMNCMFRRCYNITELDLSSFDTSKVEYIDEMFYNCDNLKTIYASNNFVTTSVPDDEGYSRYMFTGAYELEGGMGTTYSSSHIDKEYAHLDGGTTNPGYFTDKSSITIKFDANGGTGTMSDQVVQYNVSTPLTTNTFTKSGYVFVGWNTKADGTGISYLDGGSIQVLGAIKLYAQWTQITATFDTGKNVNAKMKKLAGNSSAMFNSNDNNITSIQKSSTKPDISAMTSDNIVSTSNSIVPIYMWYDNGTIYWWSEDSTPSLNNDSSFLFNNLNNVSNIELDSFDTSKVTNMGSMFNNCSSLTTLVLGDNFDTNNVESMVWMFSGCTNLSSIDISHFDTSKVTNMFNMFYNCSSLTNLDVSHFDTSEVTNMSWMFSGCKKLTSLDLSHFDTSKVTNMGSMFYDNLELRTLNISNFDTSKVTNMSDMFGNCSSLTDLNLSHFDTSQVTDMSAMFYFCEKLETLNLNTWDTSNVKDMASMFYNCSSLTNLDVSHFDTSNVTKMNSMFSTCKNITSLDLSNFNTSQVSVMHHMFYNDYKLTTLDLSNFNTSNVTDMSYMFKDCNNLTTIYAPSSFVTTNVTDSTNMFSGDTKIEGGMGTTYDSTKVDATYARIDGGTSNPGYFTYKAPSTGGNISRFINAFKSNKSIKNTILLIGMSVMIIILLLIVLFVKNKSKKNKVTIN